jgi:hypothetical protein
MCSIVTPEAEVTNGVRPMHSAKWIVGRDGASVKVSPAAECVRMLSDPARINGIKSEGMRAKREGQALVERNDYGTYCMDDVAPIPDYTIKFKKVSSMVSVRTTTYARTQTSAWDGQLFVALPVVVVHARSS